MFDFNIIPIVTRELVISQHISFDILLRVCVFYFVELGLQIFLFYVNVIKNLVLSYLKKGFSKFRKSER